MKPIGPLGRVILFVQDVAPVRDFYVNIFGFSVVPGGNEWWTEIDTGGCILALHKAGQGGAGEDSPVKLVFLVENVEEARATLIERGVKMGKIVPVEGATFCDGQDPAGNPFQISERPVR